MQMAPAPNFALKRPSHQPIRLNQAPSWVLPAFELFALFVQSERYVAIALCSSFLCPPACGSLAPGMMLKQFLDFFSVFASRLQTTLILSLSVGLLWLTAVSPAIAAVDNDSFDGNIFALYAGNGSIVPPKQSIASSIAKGRPSLLVLYLEDSSDCKRFAIKVSRVQAFYGKYLSIIPVIADSLPLESSGSPTDPATYNDNMLPKSVIFDAEGNVVLEATGNVPFEVLDDKLREVFDLLPREESEELLRRQPLNEVNVDSDI